MNKGDLLFYNEYEQFYSMAKTSKAFRLFCQKAFGKDFLQDDFSDLSQIDRVLKYIPKAKQSHILDIGCGNGKTLEYLQKKLAHLFTDLIIHRTQSTQQNHCLQKKEFIQGCIGEVDYSAESFDVIISMDTMYFSSDMNVFC